MNSNPIVIDAIYHAPASTVWTALTNPAEMKEWYFDIPTFKPEPGFQFQFSGGSEEKTYLHLCEVKEVIEHKKLSYSWKYEDVPGETLLSFELSEEDGHTHMRLTHTGLETFPQDNADFARESFSAGWDMIIGKNLKDYVESKSV